VSPLFHFYFFNFVSTSIYQTRQFSISVKRSWGEIRIMKGSDRTRVKPIKKAFDRKLSVQRKRQRRGPSDFSITVWPDLGKQPLPRGGRNNAPKTPFFIIGPELHAKNLKNDVARNDCSYATIGDFKVRFVVKGEVR
jgi:hypothetical protein